MSDDSMDFGEDFSEIMSSEHVLNLDYYLHRAIVKWQDALDMGIKLGKIDDGLTARALSADMAVGVAEAKGIVKWDSDEEFKKRLETLKESIKNEESKIQKAKIADFKMVELLKEIKKRGVKDGKVII